MKPGSRKFREFKVDHSSASKWAPIETIPNEARNVLVGSDNHRPDRECYSGPPYHVYYYSFIQRQNKINVESGFVYTAFTLAKHPFSAHPQARPSSFPDTSENSLHIIFPVYFFRSFFMMPPTLNHSRSLPFRSHAMETNDCCAR